MDMSWNMLAVCNGVDIRACVSERARRGLLFACTTRMRTRASQTCSVVILDHIRHVLISLLS